MTAPVLEDSLNRYAFDVYIDNREKWNTGPIVKELEQNGITCYAKESPLQTTGESSLSIGDVWFVARHLVTGKKITVRIEEIKRGEDFISSLFSDHLYDQFSRMRESEVADLGLILIGPVNHWELKNQKTLSTISYKLQVDRKRPISVVTVAETSLLGHHLTKIHGHLKTKYGLESSVPKVPEFATLQNTGIKRGITDGAGLYQALLLCIPRIGKKVYDVYATAPSLEELRTLVTGDVPKDVMNATQTKVVREFFNIDEPVLHHVPKKRRYH